MVIRNRGEFTDVTEQVNLMVQFKDGYGVPTDTTTFPTISIVQPDGSVLFAPTSAGIAHVGPGKYSYIFTAPINGPYGVWNDIWVGYIGSTRIEPVFSFVVSPTQMPAINSDGYAHLGDDPGFDYSQAAIHNINKLLKSLRARLNSGGKSKKVDGYGNTVYLTCDIFSADMLVTFLATILWDFNQIPHFTSFTFDDDSFIKQFGEILVEGATLYALSSKALIERGREYNITDNGLNFSPPTVSEIMMSQYSAMFASYNEKLKFIKNSIKPQPLGMGVIGANRNPAIQRLRHLRERQII